MSQLTAIISWISLHSSSSHLRRAEAANQFISWVELSTPLFLILLFLLFESQIRPRSMFSPVTNRPFPATGNSLHWLPLNGTNLGQFYPLSSTTSPPREVQFQIIFHIIIAENSCPALALSSLYDWLVLSLYSPLLEDSTRKPNLNYIICASHNIDFWLDISMYFLYRYIEI